jgi:glutamate/tyrosine decarboxylase-like PLP-dependent enzyme
MDAGALARYLDATDPGVPALVIAQAGNVNTGACDPLDAIADACERHDAWLHVDGAFGLWARVDPSHAHLVRGLERAHSLATDAHKWLNVPYDGAVVFVRDPAAHLAAMRKGAAYLQAGDAGRRDNYLYTPESSRRARATAVYAALRSLGRQGVADLVRRTCDLARRFAAGMDAHPRVTVLNDVVLNQVLLEIDGADLDDLVARVHRDGTFWAGRTVWQEHAAMRVSVSSWRTTEGDIDRCVEVLSGLIGP